MRPWIMRLALVAGLALAWNSAASAQNIFSVGHFDAPMAGWSGSSFYLEIHDHDNEAHFEPDESVLFAGPNTMMLRPGGAQWDFLGVGAGQPLWILPATQQPDMLYLGASSEEVPFGVVTPWNPGDSRLPAGSFQWVQLQVVDVRGPGRFSAYTTDTFGNPTAWVSFSEGGNHIGGGLSSSVFMLAGGHAHFNWAFSPAGGYEVDWRGGAQVGGDLITSDSETFFYTASSTAIPEPTSLALMGMAGFGLAGFGRHWLRVPCRTEG